MIECNRKKRVEMGYCRDWLGAESKYMMIAHNCNTCNKVRSSNKPKQTEELKSTWPYLAGMLDGEAEESK
jgi:hypothetical protein